ncbi:hypothetical protein [Campylobacter troglodytis]|nr:hypothetical protein [Campylobacter troglodytis]
MRVIFCFVSSCNCEQKVQKEFVEKWGVGLENVRVFTSCYASCNCKQKVC